MFTVRGIGDKWISPGSTLPETSSSFISCAVGVKQRVLHRTRWRELKGMRHGAQVVQATGALVRLRETSGRMDMTGYVEGRPSGLWSILYHHSPSLWEMTVKSRQVGINSHSEACDLLGSFGGLSTLVAL